MHPDDRDRGEQRGPAEEEVVRDAHVPGLRDERRNIIEPGLGEKAGDQACRQDVDHRQNPEYELFWRGRSSLKATVVSLRCA